MDTIVSSIVLIIPVLLLTLSPPSLVKISNRVFAYYALIILSFIIYVENATMPFMAEYDVRPNYLLVEYLIYPKEVMGMILADYKLELIVAFIMIACFAFLFKKYSKFQVVDESVRCYRTRILLLFPLLLLLFIGIRSSFGQRPANLSDAMFSSNRLLNEITKNSTYSLIRAMYANKKYETKTDISDYGKISSEEAIARVKRRLNISGGQEQSPFSRFEKSHFRQSTPKNLVIFLQESLGAQFVQVTGGVEGITPNINRLSQEAILFTDLYSNGTRSIRGIAGSVAGNFSVPGKGVLKRNRSQTDFFTISSLLKPHGYHTMFLYGGEGRFDNMKGWFYGNGFDQVIEQKQFVNPSFVGTWGVSDEDLVIRANEEFKKLHDKKLKFSAVMFSQSNHIPFDLPEGKISLVEGVPPKSVQNGVKYADYAIGKFIQLAKKEKYFEETIFVILADHNIRVYGDDLVPVNMFHIPGLIIGGGIEPMIYPELSTQPDVLATALDLLGLDFTYPIMGQSIFSDAKQNISLMQFFDSYALRVNNKVAIVRPNMKPKTFIYKNDHLEPCTADTELERDALAFVITLDHIYKNKLYN
jgi:phosphoglycerol transferase MdoB-like AlkP superfamily enzyme